MKAFLKVGWLFFLSHTVLIFQNCGKSLDINEYKSESLSSTGAPLLTPPQILSISNPGSVMLNQSVILAVSASGDQLSYQWYKDNSALSGAQSSSYNIASAHLSHAGQYTVVVSNPAGQVVSQAIPLQVLASQPAPQPMPVTPPVILSKTPDQILPFFSSIAVPLAVTASGQNLMYSWSVDYFDANLNRTVTKALSGNTNQIMTDLTSFDVMGVTYSYVTVGTYRVVVSNGAGSVSTTIKVEFMPFQFSL